jgi:phage-related protein
MPTISTLTVDVDANTSKMKSGLKSAGVALAGLGAAAVVCFNQFEDSQKVSAQTGAVLKSTGNAAHITAGQVGDLATSLSEKSGIDDEVIQSGENMLLTFKNIKNEAGKGNDVFNQASTAALDMAAGMAAASGGAVDMKSATIQLGKALNDPVKGISALSRVGVTFTAGQQKQIAAMVKTGDTMGAQKVILHELNSEFQGSAEAQATAAGKAGVAFGNLEEAIGGLVSKAITPLIALIQPVIDFLTRFPGLAAAAAVGLTLLYVGTKLYAVWQERAILLNKIMWLTNPYVLLAAAVIALVVIIVKNWATIKRVVLAVWDAIKKAGVAVFHAIMVPVRLYIAFLKLEFNVAKAIVLGAWKAILAVINGVWSAIKAAASAYFSFIKLEWRGIVAIVRTVWGAIKGIWSGAKAFFSAVFGGIVSVGKSAFNGLITVMNFFIRGLNTIIHGFNMIPGHPDIPNIPDIPSLRTGGIVLRTGLAMVHEGERFSGVGNGFGGVTVNVYGSVMTERDLATSIQRALLRDKKRSGALGLS